MPEIIQFVNRHVPVPAKKHRRRVWLFIGYVLALRGGIVLGLQRESDGDRTRLVLQATAQEGQADLPPTQLLQIGAVSIVPRAVAFRGAKPFALMLELAAEPCALYRAIEAAA